MRIFLTGYMGSGKTTLGRWLSQRLSLPFIDLDQIVEKSQGKRVEEIFEEQGETAFREIESAELKEQVELHKHFVMATGGGTACSETNLEIMNRNGLSIYLKVSPSEITRRITNETNWRPLLKKIPAADLQHFITGHLAGREKWYRRCMLVIPNEKEDFELIASHILNLRANEN